MAGPIWGTPSFMNQPSGVIPTATATGTEWTVIRAMLVRKCVAPLLDRTGCRDTDGDGWSDPTDSWPAHPFGSGDAFPTEALQWKDSDQDGFGDLPLGAFRDDCPQESGSSERDLQGCPDQNGDGWSDDYGEFAAAIAIMGEDPLHPG